MGALARPGFCLAFNWAGIPVAICSAFRPPLEKIKCIFLKGKNILAFFKSWGGGNPGGQDNTLAKRIWPIAKSETDSETKLGNGTHLVLFRVAVPGTLSWEEGPLKTTEFTSE